MASILEQIKAAAKRFSIQERSHHPDKLPKAKLLSMVQPMLLTKKSPVDHSLLMVYVQ